MRTPYATTEQLVPERATSAQGAARGSKQPRHKPPKYNIYGNQLPPGKGSGLHQPAPGVFNTTDGKVAVPSSWQGHPEHATRAALKETRRRDFLADPSFDLDGDGVVNQRDYFFAKRFDKDGDGKLNAKVCIALPARASWWKALFADRKSLQCCAGMGRGTASAAQWLRQEVSCCHGALDTSHPGATHCSTWCVQGGPAKVMAHRVLQKRGHVLMEEKEGWAELVGTS